MSTATQMTGIFQGDLVMRAALVAAFADLRKRTWLLDYAFAGLPQDGLTYEEYGEMDVARAKDWFLKTDVKVVMMPRVGSPPKMPCVTIRMASEADAENTLGDINADPVEYNDDQPPLTSKFSPESYDPATGKMKLPPEVFEQLYVVAGQLVVDREGVQHEILDAEDPYVTVEKGLSADFGDSYIVGQKPGTATSVESDSEKHTFLIGCHASGDPAQLIYLHTIVKFCLRVYKQSLLEARGLERTAMSSSDFDKNPMFDPEVVFTRVITLTGYARNMWPKAVALTVSGSKTTIALDGTGSLYPNDPDPDASWIGDEDAGSPEEEDALSGVH